MTVSIIQFRADYTAGAGQQDFTYPFRILVDTHIEVYVNQVLKTLITHYTVSGVGDQTGGTVHFLAGLVANDKVAIILTPPTDQLIDYQFNSKFPEETHETGLDKLTMIALALKEAIGRGIRFAKFSTFKDIFSPDPSPGKLLRWTNPGPGLENVDVSQLGVVVASSTNPSQIDAADAAVSGVSTEYARGDHQHPVPAPAAPVDVTKAAASAGAALTLARADHKHDISTAAPANVTKAAAAEGAASSLARSDHKHDIDTDVPVNVTKAAAAEGTGTKVARSDHKHDVTTAVPINQAFGDVAAEGSASSIARSDHKHGMPTAPSGPLDRVTANTTITNTTTETDAYSFSVPGGTVGTDGKLRLTLRGTYTNNSGGGAVLTLRAKFGATTFGTSPLTFGAGATVFGIKIVLELAGDGLTNAQIGDMLTAVQADNVDAALADRLGSGTAAEDSTAAKNIKLTVQHSVASVNITFIAKQAILEKV